MVASYREDGGTQPSSPAARYNPAITAHACQRKPATPPPPPPPRTFTFSLLAPVLLDWTFVRRLGTRARRSFRRTAGMLAGQLTVVVTHLGDTCSRNSPLTTPALPLPASHMHPLVVWRSVAITPPLHTFFAPPHASHTYCAHTTLYCPPLPATLPTAHTHCARTARTRHHLS